uniref:Structural maintenance of chromosomes protein n=1 Tax=Phallusia mammillata TaxID=59560 RepID=A0A6F9DSF9_9ASCI|nr:structural maintenance of chromosomes protein 4 [Phallusia mammillata]
MEVDADAHSEKDTHETNDLDCLELPEGIVVPPPPCVFGVGGKGDPRLIITHIVNENFKSYAGRQVLGPFHKSFTGIVGPNGSGKSNVIDSMLFVFGYRANKIRSKKLAVLIHNSENHKSFTSCTVEVHFEKIVDLDNGGYCTVPNSAFYVSRRANRDNTSQYFIEGKKSQFKDVASLLQTSGIDLNHNRFLILQGEVEQIALMKPKAVNEHGDGMLEYLEDIIGSSRYKDAIDKLGKEIEQLDEDRKDRLSRVKVVEKDKEQLEPLRNEALEFLRKQNEVSRLNNKLLQLYILAVTKEAESFKSKLDDIHEERKGIDEKIGEFKKRKKEAVKHCTTLAKHLEDASAKHLEKKEQMRELEKRNVTVFEDRKHRKAKLKELMKKIDKETKKLEDLMKRPDDIDQEIKELTEDRCDMLNRKKETEASKQKMMESLQQDTKNLQEKKEELENLLLTKMKYVNESKQLWEVSDEELQLFVRNVNKAQRALDDCKKKISGSALSKKSSSEELSKLIKEVPSLEKTIKENTTKLTSLKKQETQLEVDVDNEESVLAEAKHNAHSNRSKGAVVKFLLQLKKSGKIPGIYGRLGDLGVIEEKYDIAISSCCYALEHIVVDSIETAQLCVKALKTNQVGQATFIALDKMTKYQHAVKQKSSSPLPRLIDLITLKEEKFRVAFYHALRETLVADDISTASKVAYSKTKRWRVVTTQGEVIDTSGTMSGGGNKVMKGRMGSNYVADEIDPAEIDKLQNQINKKKDTLKKIRSSIVTVEEELSHDENKFNKLKSNIKMLEHKIMSDEKRQNDLEQQLPGLEDELNNAQPDKEQLFKLKSKSAALRKDYDKVAKNAEDLEQKKDKIHEEICETTNERMKPLHDRLKNLNQNIDEAAKKLTKLKVALTTSKRNQEKSMKTLQNLECEIKENKECIENLEQQWKQLEVDGANVLEEVHVSEIEDKKLSEELHQQQVELKKLEDEELSFLDKCKKIKQLADSLNSEYNSRMDKAKDHQEELQKLKLHEIDDEEIGEFEKYTEEELVDEPGLRNQINILDHDLSNMKPSMNAIEEYKTKQKIYLQRVAELDKVTEKRDQYRGMHDQLRKNRLNEFSEGFSVITNKLKEIYQMITLGGDAELEFVDSLDPFSEGIVFSVRPPKKSWKNICNLSGGEKTLSSLALVFALHHYRPTPLYVMDEIDAALDFKNVSIIARYIIERTKNAQFIIISLRNNMFEVADRLVGIYKTDNCTKCAPIEPNIVLSALS